MQKTILYLKVRNWFKKPLALFIGSFRKGFKIKVFSLADTCLFATNTFKVTKNSVCYFISVYLIYQQNY